MKIKQKIPRCFGLLYDPKEQDCQCCLLNTKCSKSYYEESGNTPPAPQPKAKKMSTSKLDKKELVLAVYAKFGLEPIINTRSGPMLLDITKAREFTSIDQLVTKPEFLEFLLNLDTGAQ